MLRAESEINGSTRPNSVTNGNPSKENLKSRVLLFEIVSANNVVEGDRKFVLYRIMMKKHILDSQPVFLKRRYSEFHNLYSVFNSKHSHKQFNRFQFPKKSLISTLSQEQIAERARGLEQFLNLISSCELVNSHTFEMFLYKKKKYMFILIRNY